MKSKKAKKVKGAPPRKTKGGNDRPSRTKYWASGRLETHKVKALMQHCGMTRGEATALWRETRVRNRG